MKALRAIRGALGMGVTWAIGWALFGLLIGVASKLLPWLPWEPFFQFFDAPLPALAVPGFIGGVLFSIVLGIVARRRRFDQLSVSGFAAWGAFGGLLLSLIPAALVAAGLATTSASILGLTAIIAPPLMVLCSLSAAGSLRLARLSAEGQPSRHQFPAD